MDNFNKTQLELINQYEMDINSIINDLEELDKEKGLKFLNLLKRYSSNNPKLEKHINKYKSISKKLAAKKEKIDKETMQNKAKEKDNYINNGIVL